MRATTRKENHTSSAVHKSKRRDASRRVRRLLTPTPTPQCSACDLKNGETQEALSIMPVFFATRTEQIPQAEDRYDLYLENKSWEKAAEAAARLKDPRYILGTACKSFSLSPELSSTRPPVYRQTRCRLRGVVCGSNYSII